jgi:hypothetical protein
MKYTEIVIFGMKIYHLGSMLWSQFSSIFGNFCRKQCRVSQKTMLWSNFCITASFWVKKRQFFAKFWRKYSSNHGIGPWQPCSTKRQWIGFKVCVWNPDLESLLGWQARNMVSFNKFETSKKSHPRTLTQAELQIWQKMTGIHFFSCPQHGAGWPDAFFEKVAQYVTQSLFCQNY